MTCGHHVKTSVAKEIRAAEGGKRAWDCKNPGGKASEIQDLEENIKPVHIAHTTVTSDKYVLTLPIGSTGTTNTR
jgi:hypothetical protein